MNVMKKQIKDVFTNLKKLKESGIWFSGIEKEGEYKTWHENGQLWIHSFYKDKEREGEYKAWWNNGQLWVHCFYNGKDEYKDEYKRWNSSGELVQYEIYNDDGSLKETIV